MSRAMMIRHAVPEDAGAIWHILEPTIRAGETYAVDRAMSRSAALDWWLAGDHESFVAENAGEVVGTYYIRPNQPAAAVTSATAAT